MGKQYFVYIMTNNTNTVTYKGVTNDLIRRIYEHKNKLMYGFTKRYNINKLVHFELFNEIESAIMREKQIKSWPRKRKVALISESNPAWCDLYEGLMEG
jgi:putative endonuclease